MKRLIPTNTKITDAQLEMLRDKIIPDRVKELHKQRRCDVEMSLWLMSELEHLKKLRDNNLDGTANEPHPDLQTQAA